MGLWARLFGSSEEPDFVRCAVAQNQPECELLISMLRDHGIPAFYGRTRGFDVPDMLAAGPRDILVPGHLELEARGVLQPILEEFDGDREAVDD